MTDMKGMLREAKKGNPLIITHAHAAWLEMGEDAQRAKLRENRELVQEVIDKLIFGTAKVPRVGRIGASGLGMCMRRQLFSYAGAPKTGEDPDTEDLMSMGTHDHLWWQIEGMVMGWLYEVEPFVSDGLTGGSLDGAGTVVGPFELKTLMSQKYTRIVQIEKCPAEENAIQFDFYQSEYGDMPGSMVYQERGGGAFHEYRLEVIPSIRRKRLRIQEQIGNHVADNTLPEMLEDCEMRVGTIYRQCPYRKYCPTARSVTVKP